MALINKIPVLCPKYKSVSNSFLKTLSKLVQKCRIEKVSKPQPLPQPSTIIVIVGIVVASKCFNVHSHRSGCKILPKICRVCVALRVFERHLFFS